MTISEILLLLFISLFHLFLLKKIASGNLLKILTVFSIIKISTAFFFTAYYIEGNSNPMSADVFKYFHDADILFQNFETNPTIYFKILLGIDTNSEDVFYQLNKTEFYFHSGNHWTNDDHLMIKLNMIIRLFSFGNIYIHSLVFCVISFWASLYFVRKTEKKIAIPKSLIYFTIFLIPSVLFWSSAAIKETLLISALLVSTSIIFFIQNKKINHWLLLLICIYLIVSIRPALLISFIVGSITSIILIKIKGKRLFTLTAVIFLFFILLILNPEIPGLIINKRNELIETATKVNANTIVNNEILTPSVYELVKILPSSFFYGIAEPVIWKIYPFTARLFGLEILLLLLFVIISIDFKNFRKQIENLEGLCMVSGSLIYIFIIGLTTPVAGAITRYRSITLPFLLLGIYQLFILKLFIYDFFKRIDIFFDE